jgi:excisionase family DNA binding protein
MREPLINVPKLSATLGVDRRTVMELARTGRIPSIRIGSRFRFNLEAVLERLTYQPRILK